MLSDRALQRHVDGGISKRFLRFTIKRDVIKPKREAEISGAVIDAGLRLKNHLAQAATKGLTPAVPPNPHNHPKAEYASILYSHIRGSEMERVETIEAHVVLPCDN